jgi:hypothetical protein
LEFDKLIGKVGPNEDMNGEIRAMSESDINNSSDFELPILTKKQQFQMTQFKQDEPVDNRSLLTSFMDQPNMPFNSRCLQMMVPSYRPFHHTFKPKPLEADFIRPIEQPRPCKCR